jgi:hypothetical protein
MSFNVNTGTKPVVTMTGLNVSLHDYISISPPTAPSTGSQTIVFKTGGAGGTTVATLTLVFSGGDLASVTKS